jgi:uncharacterized protein (TIGR02647 family)
MPFNTKLIEELNILAKYNLDTTQEGLKVHQHTAPEGVQEAVQRLFDKGLITQSDGGYLTALGRDAAEYAQGALVILNG